MKKFCIKCHKRITKGRNLWCNQCLLKLNKNMADETITPTEEFPETPIEGEFPEEVPVPEVPPEEKEEV